MALNNRMFMSPMTTAYCNDDQTPRERLIRYFEERAKGGVGLITMELITLDETHPYMHRSMTLGGDKYIDAARRAREAGYDGIELHAAHCCNLLGSFLSPRVYTPSGLAGVYPTPWSP